MRNIIFSAILLSLVFLSCGKKEEETSSDDKVQIINALNLGHSDLAIELSQKGIEKSPNDNDYAYYLAQGYSQKADIDIYTLFPLVKLQVFDLAISEWQAAGEFEKRQNDSVSRAILGTTDNQIGLGREENILERIEEIEELPYEDFDIAIYPINFSCFETTDSSTEENKVFFCYYQAEFSSPHPLLEGLKDTLGFSREFDFDPSYVEFSKPENYPEVERLKIGLKHAAKEELQKKIKQIKQNKVMQKYIKAAYALFDSVPILKAIPIVQEFKLKNVFESITILEDLLTKVDIDSRIGKNATQQLGLLGGYLISYGLKSGIDMNKVNEPIDLACHANPYVLVENYQYFRTGIKSLFNATIHTEFYKKNQNNLDKAQELMKELPDEIDDGQKLYFIDEVEDFQKDNC